MVDIVLAWTGAANRTVAAFSLLATAFWTVAFGLFAFVEPVLQGVLVCVVAVPLHAIAYTTAAPAHVSLKVYDGAGRLVQTLVNSHQPAGEKSAYWDSRDLNQRQVSNGVYFLKLEADNQIAVHKLILVR